MLHQQSVTHDPRAGLTPTQLRDFDETLARRARMAARAVYDSESAPSDKTCHPEPIPNEPAPISPPAFKEPWFSIVCEVDGPLRIETIQKVVLARFPKVTRADLLSARRSRDVVIPRQIAMYLTKTLTPKSLPEIGRRFGGRDHTTVLHAVRKIARLVDVNADIAADIAIMSGLLQGAR